MEKELQDKVEQLTDEIKKLKEEIEQLLDNIRDKERAYDSLEMEKDELEAENRNLEKELEKKEQNDLVLNVLEDIFLTINSNELSPWKTNKDIIKWIYKIKDHYNEK